MSGFEILFWVLLTIVFYTYLGYGILLVILVLIKQLFTGKPSDDGVFFEPSVTMFVAAYNEKDYVEEKVLNILGLDYPKEKLQILFVTDGSDDGTPELLSQFQGVKVMHREERSGKISAINRGMNEVENSIVIYSDANAMLNKQAIREIVKHYKDPKVGCVSGEKRIYKKNKDGAIGSGEGLYWKYESILKKLDFRLYSAVGAAGELFSIRTELHQDVEKDTLLDDFVISLRIAQKSYKIAYEPNAYASENASASIKEEMKRKIRISAGGIQSIIRLSSLFNFFKYHILTFQYVSHRVLRWTLSPLALFAMLPVNFLLMQNSVKLIYEILFFGQIVFYIFALLGWYLENKQIRIKFLFVPYYFFFMNVCVFLGFLRYLRGNQSVIWEKALRS